MEHRWGQRTAADVIVRLIGSPGAIGTGRLRNVSTTGAFMQADLQLPPLTPVRVEWLAGTLPPGHPCVARAYVVRQVSAGVGIEWFAVDFDPAGAGSMKLAEGDLLATTTSMRGT